MKKILVIDDEDLVRDFLKTVLEKADYKVMVATNGEEGLDLFQSFKPDLVITDIVMPEKDGIELIMEIRKSDSSVKFIAISGGGYVTAEKYLNLAKALEIDTCFYKPLHAHEIIAAVQDMIGN